MDFQGYLRNTYEMVKREPLFFILGGLLTQFLTMLSLSLLAGPLIGAYMLAAILFLRQGKRPLFNDLFSGLPRFKELFSFFFLLLVIMLGLMLLILPGIVFATWWMYTLPLMVDKKMSMGEAMRESLHAVNEKGFFMHLVFLLLITFVPFVLLNFAAALLPPLFILKILLLPLQTGCLIGLYLHTFDSITATDISFADTGAQSEPPRSLPES